jgi:nucleoside-diphosphate-sugar epimerase
MPLPGPTSTLLRPTRRERRRSTSQGTAHAAALKAPLVAFSTDYVFDGRKRSPYVESDGPNPTSAYGRTKLHGEAAAGTNAWVVRTSWLFGPTGHNFLRTMLRLGAERDELAVVDDQRGCPTFVGHLAEAVHTLVVDDRPKGLWHLAADGRLHVGRLRGGDLRGVAPRLSSPSHHDRRDRASLPRGPRTRCSGANVPRRRASALARRARACLAEMTG